MNAPSLFDAALEVPSIGRTRTSDPATSVTAAKRTRVGAQKRRIACELARLPYVTADSMADGDPDGIHRSTWSARLGDLVRDGILAKGDPVRGASQQVLSYHLTEKGRAWVRQIVSECLVPVR